MSQRELFLRYVAQTSPSPLLLEIEKAEGIYLYAPSGKKYIDLISGISVSNVGHRHPKVLEAIENQLQKYLHLMVYGEYVQSPQVLLAQKLVENLPNHLDNVYFTNSGSEAVEGALKLAKRYTGRSEIISCYNAYHGSTQGALSVGGNEYFKRAYRPLLPCVKHIHYGSYSDLTKITEKTACVIIETIQGEAGVKVACSNYFQQLAKRCKQVGALLILDEIQAGFGRTGKLWAFEHFGIVPDILVLAKGMGGGMPIGAFVANRAVMQSFTYNPVLGHITTFGGHPVSAAAAKATLEIILSEQLAEQAESKAQLFLSYLKHPQIRQIRYKGLLMAVEFESFNLLKKIIDKALDLGVITDWFLFCDNAMRIAPPLTITETEIEQSCELILKAIKQVYS
ncbi:MAG: aspartate aminotransferase family protein [Raineya sp.]|nr:aspartate aminotransferase family protein [Raineya sp.]MDW8295816.1 aspartate aminotransferase family protein [Raineya sp.]